MATRVAASASRDDIQTQIALSSSGDIVSVPADTKTWNGTEYITIPEGVSVIGAGLTTIITDGYFKISANSRLSAVYIKSDTIAQNVLIPKTVTANNGWRIDNCKFENLSADNRTLVMSNGPATDTTELGQIGLIDNCSFINGRINVYGNANTGTADPGYIFLEDTGLGTNNAVYIEDCTFQFLSGYAGGNAVDALYGGRYVVRHCSFIDTYCEAHGPATAVDNEPNLYATRSFEIYENTFVSTGDKEHTSLGRIRGGTGVIYNNSFTRTGGSNPYQLMFDYPPEGNEGCTYPGPFQLGRGRWPAGTTRYNVGVGGEFPEQNLEPVYCWGNTIDSGDWYTITGVFIQASRDVYVSTTHPTYTPYTYPHPLRGIPTETTSRMHFILT